MAPGVYQQLAWLALAWASRPVQESQTHPRIPASRPQTRMWLLNHAHAGLLKLKGDAPEPRVPMLPL
jgi:hypothetical protein